MDRRRRYVDWLSLAVGAVLVVAASGTRGQLAPGELLPLSEAFRLEVSRPGAERLQVRWTIAEGYYLYRHRFRFEAAPARIRDGFVLPPGIAKHDPFFGETQIYRRSVAFDLPLHDSAAALDRVSLRVVSQGCADVGICFPPEARVAHLSVGETAVPKAADPFAPVAAEQPAQLLFPASPNRSRWSPAGRSP
jgi:thiol:disulfide interchange protein DsbD